MKRLVITTMALLFFCAACATSQSSTALGHSDAVRVRERYVSDHMHELTPEVASAIRAGVVRVGMTAEQAEIAWATRGAPRISRTETEVGTVYEYSFPPRYGFFLVQRGRVIAVHDGR
jgi:hypothetical protein